MLDRIVSRFDRLVAASAKKTKTIGDACTVAAGVSGMRPAPVLVALCLPREVRAIRTETGTALGVRIGLHTGL